MFLVLFDIDGTLVRTRGAGRESLDAAFAAVHGWENATEGVHVAGSTDGAIVRDVSARFSGEAVTERVQAHYYAALAARLVDRERVRLCPGVVEILDALQGRVHLALLTGNWGEGARIKLEACGLWERFAFGAFADDAVDRNDLVPVAVARARERGLTVTGVVVIGDTPADVACARAGGAVAVAVETGFAAPGALARARPDLLLKDLASGGAWLRTLVASPLSGQ